MPAALWLLASCEPKKPGQNAAAEEESPAASVVRQYRTVRLTADVHGLTEKERAALPLLIRAAQQMDSVFWLQSWGQPDSLLAALTDETMKQAVQINYGPWDRLGDNRSFVPTIGPKPEGARFYPEDMTKEEFEAANLPDKKSQYTLLRRDAQGKLITQPYREAFKRHHETAARLLRMAADLAETQDLKNYLTARAKALETDQYLESDRTWLDMKQNRLDIVIGPIETYEDQLFGYKAAHEAYVLIKDTEWSGRLAKYNAMLPALQRTLPTDAKYKAEKPGTDSDLGAYDVVYYAGDCNAGSKTIAVNLPNDESIQLEKGTRRLQLKNAMRAKYDHIMQPVSEELIAADQRKHLSFDAFFANTMFHEVAHGLGIKSTVNGKGKVKDALKETASAIEEGKADILGIHMVSQLHQQGELGDMPLNDYYVTFVASIFRSVRFGAASAHGVANMLRFNFFLEQGAIVRDPNTGTYRVDFERMKTAIAALSDKILRLQGDGDYEGAKAWIEKQGKVSDQLKADLERLNRRQIPVDVVFEQGIAVLGINP